MRQFADAMVKRMVTPVKPNAMVSLNTHKVLVNNSGKP